MNRLKVNSNSPEAHSLAARAVARGGVVAFRTDTFYGLGADPFNAEALKRIKQLKGRDEGKPILVVLADAGDAARFVASNRNALFKLLSERHWPGPLTIVAEARAEVPEELTARTGSVGVRLPDDAEVRRFVRACGGALTATSANLSGEPPARSADEVARSFPAGLALIVDGGDTRAEHPSTVIDVTADTPRLIREGVVSKHELLQTLQTAGKQLEV